MKPEPKQCPKCWELSPGFEIPRFRPDTPEFLFGDPLNDPFTFSGTNARLVDFDEMWVCPHHGHFGKLRNTGQIEFAEEDTWVMGPNGEKLFRM